jgi:hypothetical protein
MPTEATTTSSSGLDVNKLLSELEVPFSPDQVRWRVTNTTNDRKRGQIVPYADSRAYTDRLNALFTPHGWTREYKVETMTNITRVKKGESIISGKVLVTCTVTILGIGSHSGTGEEWADDDNGMTSADAQAFKRACSCFGLGRYFYDTRRYERRRWRPEPRLFPRHHHYPEPPRSGAALRPVRSLLRECRGQFARTHLVHRRLRHELR